jgi:hypothetical protein
MDELAHSHYLSDPDHFAELALTSPVRLSFRPRDSGCGSASIDGCEIARMLRDIQEGNFHTHAEFLLVRDLSVRDLLRSPFVTLFADSVGVAWAQNYRKFLL